MECHITYGGLCIEETILNWANIPPPPPKKPQNITVSFLEDNKTGNYLPYGGSILTFYSIKIKPTVVHIDNYTSVNWNIEIQIRCFINWTHY